MAAEVRGLANDLPQLSGPAGALGSGEGTPLHSRWVCHIQPLPADFGSRRCRRRGARLSCAIAPEQASRLATDAQAYSQVSHGPFDIRHRQTAFIRGGKSRTAVTDRPRERLATEQPGRELARPSAATRAKDAAVPVSRIGSEIPLSTCACLLRRDCTRQSSTSPSASTARHRYIILPPIETNISSRCQIVCGLGRIALRRRA